MRRIKIIVSYDGTNYCGWQLQPNGITIEEMLNRALRKLTGEEITVIGASRTDSGVHALGNVAVFDTASSIPPAKFAPALNQSLPADIVIVESAEVPGNWHPRYQNSCKIYEYHIIQAKTPIPTKRFTNYFVSYDLDIAKMREGARCLIGEHDFASFCSSRTQAKSTVRTIYDLKIVESGNEIVIWICGNGFLYNMVRIIAGTLIQVGRGFYNPTEVKEILDARKRTSSGVTAPPQGLILAAIEYFDKETENISNI